MKDDIPKDVENETDELAERIFSEWDKWFEGTDDPRRVELKEMQNKSLETEEILRDETLDEEKRLEINENLTVLKKKMRKLANEVLSEIKPKPVKKKGDKGKKSKGRRRKR